MGEAWDLGKPGGRLRACTFLGLPPRGRGQSEHPGRHPQRSWLRVGFEEDREAFQGAPALWGGARLGPGRQLASRNPAISRQRRLGGGAGRGGSWQADSYHSSCLRLKPLPPHCPGGFPGCLVGPQADKALGSWEGMQNIRKAGKTILIVKLYYWMLV